MNEEILESVILEVLQTGDEDMQPWAFYENPNPLSTWGAREIHWERGRFARTVIARYRLAMEKAPK